jgi:DNA-binding response OmpR family regulator
MLVLPQALIRNLPVSKDEVCSKSGKHILLIEYFDEILETLTFLLQHEGHCVDQAHNGVEGWRKFQRQPFDVILVDIDLPEIASDLLIERISDSSPLVPIIVMTASDIDTARILMQSGRVFRFLQKPFSISKLTEILWAL